MYVWIRTHEKKTRQWTCRRELTRFEFPLALKIWSKKKEEEEKKTPVFNKNSPVHSMDFRSLFPSLFASFPFSLVSFCTFIEFAMRFIFHRFSLLASVFHLFFCSSEEVIKWEEKKNDFSLCGKTYSVLPFSLSLSLELNRRNSMIYDHWYFCEWHRINIKRW